MPLKNIRCNISPADKSIGFALVPVGGPLGAERYSLPLNTRCPGIPAGPDALSELKNFSAMGRAGNFSRNLDAVSHSSQCVSDCRIEIVGDLDWLAAERVNSRRDACLSDTNAIVHDSLSKLCAHADNPPPAARTDRYIAIRHANN